jgi:hypothetical protein
MSQNEEEFTNEDRLEILKQIRSAVYGIIKSTFDDIDTSIRMYTFTKEDLKLARVSKLRMALKNLRAEKLESIDTMGRAHELKIEEQMLKDKK